MPKYLLSRLSASGERASELVVAESPEAAAEQLRATGAQDVRLRFRAPLEELLPNQPDPSPELVFLAVDCPRLSAWRRIAAVGLFATRGMRKLWLLAIIGFAIKWFAYRFSRLDLLAIAIVALIPFALAAYSEFFGLAARFHRITRLAIGKRWEDVQQQLPKLRGAIPNENYSVMQAKALAGIGRLDEGIELLEELNSGEDDARHWMAVSSLYSIAERHDDAIRSAAKSMDLDANDPEKLLGASHLYLLQTDNVTRPRELFNLVSGFEISEDLWAKYKLTAGALLLAEGDAAGARSSLEEALRDASRFSKAMPEYGLIVDLARGYLCLAEAKLGNWKAADQHFAASMKRLQSVGGERMMDRINEVYKGAPRNKS